MDESHIDAGQTFVRRILRVAGPAVGLIGLGFLIVGGVDFFARVGGNEPPRLFWCLCIGIPLLLAGAVATQFVFADKVARSAVDEAAPAAEAASKSAAEGTKERPGTVADALEERTRQGGSSGGAPTAVRCQNCSAVNPAEAKFCSRCGEALVKSRICPNCGELNEPKAKFCENCCHVFR